LELERLRRAGASFENSSGSLHTTVTWQERQLRDYMLLDVLMHEVGHHLIQHHKGKRREQVARGKDHEAFAELFAQRCRELYLQEDLWPKPAPST
jgi:hypothetical protein